MPTTKSRKVALATRNVLVTGGGGFLGSHLVDALLASGDEVFVLDTGSDARLRHNIDNPRFHFIPDSILNARMVESLMMRCEVVYHLASVLGTEHPIADPYKVLNVNVNGTQRVLQSAHKYGRKVIYASSSEVYGRNPGAPFKEEADRVLGATTTDRWTFATAKAACEHFCYAYAKMGMKMVILRYFNVYGPGQEADDRGSVLSIFLKKALKGDPITVTGDGNQTRCFTYVEDAIRATIQAGFVEEAEGKSFNVGTRQETTIGDLARTIVRLTGSKSAITTVPLSQIYGKSYEDVPRRVPDIDRMEKILGVKPITKLEEGLANTIDWLLKRVDA